MNVECAAMQRLIVKDDIGERTFDLLDSPIVIGRAPEVKLLLTDKESSRRHCQVERVDLGWKVVDLESRNGTRVNGKFVNQHLLKPGDVISIGKATMAFQDPDWKPPAVPDDISRYAATPVTAGSADVAEAAGAAAVEPPPPERPRTGHTTSVGRRSRVDSASAAHEAHTLKLVGVFVGIFLFGVVVLIVWGVVTAESPVQIAARNRIEQARKLGETDPRGAINLLSEIGNDAGGYYREAQRLIEEFKAKAEGPAASTPEEEEALRKLNDLVTEANGRAAFADRIVKAAQDFKNRFSRSAHLAHVDDIVARATKDKTMVRGSAIEAMDKQVADLLTRKEFASAWKVADETYAKYKTDLDVRPAIEKRMSEITEAENKYYSEETTRAKLLTKSNPEIAKQIYLELLSKLGNGRVDAFSTQCKTIQALLDQLK